MSRTTIVRTIAAPIARVFETVANPENFSRAVPHIVSVEILTDHRLGVGTRFREVRRMRGKESTTELECTEYVVNDRVRMVADEGGTIWDSVFLVQEEDDRSVRLTLVMEARPHTFLSRLITPLIRGMIQRAIEGDMDAVKAFCETADP